MRSAVNYIVLALLALSCALPALTVADPGLKIRVEKQKEVLPLSDSLDLNVTILNESDTIVNVYTGLGTFWILDYSEPDYATDRQLAHSIDRKVSRMEIESHSEVTLIIRFVEAEHGFGHGTRPCKIWYRYSWEQGDSVYNMSIVSDEVLYIEVTE